MPIQNDGTEYQCYSRDRTQELDIFLGVGFNKNGACAVKRPGHSIKFNFGLK